MMYYDGKFNTQEDIYSYVVFKKRSRLFNSIFGKRTVRRNIKYNPEEGKRIYSEINNFDSRKAVIGIFSCVSWCPLDDPACEVWLCRIPKGSVVYMNNFEYASDTLEFICGF